MDEAGLAARAVSVALEAATTLGADPSLPIRRIRVLVGGIHAVDPDSFELGFRVASGGTAAADASLELLAVPVSVRCRACGAKRATVWDAMWDVAACHACGSLDVDVSGGDELRVAVVELEDGRVAQASGPVEDPVPEHRADQEADAGDAAGASGTPRPG